MGVPFSMPNSSLKTIHHASPGGWNLISTGAMDSRWPTSPSFSVRGGWIKTCSPNLSTATLAYDSQATIYSCSFAIAFISRQPRGSKNPFNLFPVRAQENTSLSLSLFFAQGKVILPLPEFGNLNFARVSAHAH